MISYPMKKHLLFFAMLLWSGLAVQAQEEATMEKTPAVKQPRLSPPDTVRGAADKDVSITVAYSQPSLKGRKIGSADFVPYGKVWRLGANEATTIEFGWPAIIDGKTLPAGKYGLYAIPGEKEWVLIFNSVWKVGGLDYTNNEAAGSKTDVLRITVKREKAAAYTERLKFYINSSGGPGKVYFVWGDYLVGFNVR